MKKLLTLFIVAFAMIQSLETKAQNVQVLYDTERACVTSTVEMFRPDSFGSTYFFIDMDCNPRMSGAYWEIARELCFRQDTDMSWLSAHVEYNGGLNTQMSFNNCWLGGLTYSGHSKDFSKTWSLSALYKLIPGTVGLSGKPQAHNFQIPGVWGINFANGWGTFSGFIDFWREWRPWQNTSHILLSEPQLWLNMNKIKGWDKVNLSVGTEVEISNNFVSKGFYAIPTLAAKWTF